MFQCCKFHRSEGYQDISTPRSLKSKNFKCFNSAIPPVYLFKKNKISVQSDNHKKTELACKEAHTFFSLSNYISSDHEDRCKRNSTLKTMESTMVDILLSFLLSDTVQNLSDLYEKCDRQNAEITR